MSRDSDVSLLWLVAAVVRERRLLALFTAGGLLLGLAFAMVRPRTWTTNFSFVPQANQDARSGLASQLAGQFGINLGNLGSEGPPPQFYADLLTTRGILGPIASTRLLLDGDSVPVARFFKVRGEDTALVHDKTMRALRSVVTTSITARTGMVRVQVRTKSPEASRQIGQRLLAELDHFNTVTRQSQAREEARFTAGRLAEARQSLANAEEALLRFTLANRDITNSRPAQLQQQRLQREVTLQQQVVTTLAQQYEENRIREVRDTPVLTIIEAPVRPVRPNPRLRGVLLALGLLGGLFAGLVAVLGRDAWRRERARGDNAALAVIETELGRLRRAPAGAAAPK